MRVIYHFPLCPFSRKVRIVLKEKSLPFSLHVEPFWEQKDSLIRRNPAKQVPLLVNIDSDEKEHVIIDSVAICEFLEDTHPEPALFPKSFVEKAEIRRLIAWFDQKLYQDVTCYLLYEKIIYFYTKQGQPNSSYIRLAKENFVFYLDYMTHLKETRNWLGGDHFSLADITAAAHLSVLDYMGEIYWKTYPVLHEWYALVKSRPSFRPLLSDRISGFTPPSYYADPDF